MEITTKFNVNDLVVRKWDTNIYDEAVQASEIMELSIQACYSTIQVFYFVKPICAQKKTEGYGADKKSRWIIGHGIGKEDNSSGWKKYREDELI